MMNSRRTFIKKSMLGLGALTVSNLPMACQANNETQRLGVALVGLGGYSTNHLAPALQETKHCKLTAIVTGTPEKTEKWSKQYNIPKTHIYNYETYDSIADNPDVDIVYIVLPNSMHADFTIRAAKAGKHVICEKPMAVSVKEAEAMIAVCKAANVKLQIGYRLQYEPFNQHMMHLAQDEVYGKVIAIETSNAFRAEGWDNWRFHHKLSGGGPLMDMGIYCIQGARYTLGAEPIAVTAQSIKTRPEKFVDVEETLFWQMEFPNNIMANCMTSYSVSAGRLHVMAEKGNFELSPAYSYDPLKGWEKGKTMDFPVTNQQAVQMDAFAKNILENTPIIASGEEGLKDMKVIEAIYEAMKTGTKIKIQ